MPTEKHQSDERAMLIFGAGGHARVVADAVQRAGLPLSLLASDRNEALCHGELCSGVPLTRLSAIAPWPGTVHVAIGDNTARERESLTLGGDAALVTVCHPAASVSPHAHVGVGCFVAAQAVVAPGARLGSGVIINHGAVVDHDCTIGAFAHIAPRAVLGGQVHIGQRVLVGAGSVVLPGRSVVADTVIGAGAVVCKNIDTPGTYAGVPARRIS